MFSTGRACAYGSIAALVIAISVGGLIFLVAERYRDEQDVIASLQANCNIFQISLAMHSYHEKYGHLPPAYVLGADGKPAHSWRVLLLEFLDGEELLNPDFRRA